MKITFLSAGNLPLAKQFTNTNGVIEKTPYPMVGKFSSIVEEVDTIEGFYDKLQLHGSKGHALYKGMLDKELNHESRAGHTLTNEETEWVCLDFDGMQGFGSIPMALATLGFGDVDHIIQWSASQGMKPGLNAHVFMLLDKKESPAYLKRWLKYLNLNIPQLFSGLELTKSNMALLWPLDITVCQNDKLLYIADPVFENVADPLNGAPRIELIKGSKRTISLDSTRAMVNTSSLEDDERARIEDLRKSAGLRKLTPKIEYSRQHNQVVMKNPQEAVVTGEKEARGFVYLNINGGDSWAYFHPVGNPELIHNFKGEPSYLAEKFVPEYYARAISEAKHVKQEANKPKDKGEKIQRFVFNERTTSKYYKATYDPVARTITLDPASDLKRLQDFCLRHGLPEPDIIDDWEITFDPTSTTVIDEDNKRINIYKPSEYRVKSLAKLANADITLTAPVDVPERYRKLIMHVLGDDEEAYDRFMNWLAFVWQTGQKPKTAWVLHGTQGTGKGILFQILKEIFGEQQVVALTAGILGENFNKFLETAQILFVDEADMDQADHKKIEPKLKNWITEETVSVRAMRQDARQVHSYMGVLLASNQHNPTHIALNDRRFNVPPRQETRYSPSDDEYEALFAPKGLQRLSDAFTTYAVDSSKAKVAMESAQKIAVQETTAALPEEIIDHLERGNLEYFIDHAPEPSGLPVYNEDHEQYITVFRRVFVALSEQPPNTPVSAGLSREDLRVIFKYLAGWKQESAKFNKALSRFGMSLSSSRIHRDGRTLQGKYFTWMMNEELRDRCNHIFGAEKPKQVTNEHSRGKREQS